MSEEMTYSSERRLSVIMFSDIVGYSKMMQSDEKLTMDLLSRHDAIIRESLKQYDGTEIKVIGDAFLVSFSTVTNAVQCAIEIQEKFTKYNEEQNERERIQVRIGIHLGDIVIKENDVFGDGVNIASRIEPLAEPGGICISQEIYNLVKHKLDLQVVSLGPKELKNIKDKIEIYQILVGSIAGRKWKPAVFKSKIRQRKYFMPLIAIIIFTILMFIYFQFKKQPKQVQIHPLKVRSLDVDYPNISFDGNWVIYVTGYIEGVQNLYIEHISGGESRRLTNDTIFTLKTSPCFSPDGSRIAFSYWNGDENRFIMDIYVIPTLGGRAQKIIETAQSPVWSPDEHSISFIRNEENKSYLWLYDVTDAKEKKILPMWPRPIAWSPDSKEIAFLKGFTSQEKQDYTEIFIYDISKEVERQLTDDKNYIDDLCWTTNNDIIFNSTRGGTVNLWSIPVNGGALKQVTLGQGGDRCPHISKDGKHLVYINKSLTLNVWKANIETKKTSQVTFEDRGCYGASYSPDGNKIAWLEAIEYNHTELIVCNSDGSEPKNYLLGNDKAIRGWDLLQWSSDGKQIAFSVDVVDTLSKKNDSVRHTASILLLDLFNNKLRKIGEGLLYAWSSDGKYMIYLPEENAQKTFLTSPQAFDKTVREIKSRRISTFSRDCRNIFYSDSLGIWSMKIEDGSKQLLVKIRGVVLEPQETPDMKEIAFLYLDEKNRSWDVKSLSKQNKNITTLFSLPPRTYIPISYSPDMKTIIFSREQENSKIMVIENLY
jgi:class 3 adenylate cyclase/Tol biopolymer transport system component